MTTPDALRRRAERAAATIIAEHNLTTLGVSYDVLVAVVAVGWLEGYDASSVWTREAIQGTLAQHERGVRPGDVTPCSACHGTGQAAPDIHAACSICNGTGRLLAGLHSVKGTP